MKLGFTLRTIVTKFERIARISILYLDYFLWGILSLERFFTKKPKIRKVLVVHHDGYLGDAVSTFCVFDKVRKKYKKIDFYMLTTQNFAKMIDDKNVMASIEEIEKIQPFDIMIIIGISPLNFQKIFHFSDYKIGSQTGGVNTFLSTSFFLTKRIYPYFKPAIKERFMYFELAGFKFDNYDLKFPKIRKYQKEAKKLVKKLKLNKKQPIIFFNPGANSSLVAIKEGLYPSNKWDRFSELADLINKNIRILIDGFPVLAE